MTWVPRQKATASSKEPPHKDNDNHHHHNQPHNRPYDDYHNNHYYHNRHNQNNYKRHNNNSHNNHYYHRSRNPYNKYNSYNQPSYTNIHGPNIRKDNKHVKYVKNTGKWHIEEIPSNELVNILQSIWNNYYHQNVEVIQKIVLLCGPPGCGKTSVSTFVEQYYNLNTSDGDHLIDVSSIISKVIKENNGKIIMYEVYEKLLRQIAENVHQHRVLIIDGFLRKEQHVYVVNCLKWFMRQTAFIFVVMDIDEETSVKRQLQRGQRLLQLSKNNKKQSQQHQKQRLKESDLYEGAARKRYQKYNRLLGVVRYQLQREMKGTYDIIDATKSMDDVLQSVKIQLKKQDS